MENSFTQKEIAEILWQLDKKQMPFFRDTMIHKRRNAVVMLGEGGSGYVYDCYNRRTGRVSSVVKVIGFKEAMNYEEIQREIFLQQKLAKKCKHVVQIYEYCCLNVWIDAANQVINVGKVSEGQNTDQFEGDCITLAFIRMEKLQPVLYKDNLNQMRCASDALISESSEEVVKLFYDIACALEVAHRKKVLHGDVKLENIFYDEKCDIYKLGDFGSSVQTEYGVARAAGYTNGYVAPEVYNCMIKKYDASADIYSLGMVIFILRNQLVKPGSDNYHANLEYQYQEGFVLDRPTNEYGNDNHLYDLLRQMCNYIPSERPQNMKTIIGVLAGRIVRPLYGWQVRYSVVYFVLGILLFIYSVIYGTSHYDSWVSDYTLLGFVVFLKALTLKMRNRKAYRYLYLWKKVDLVYILSLLLIEVWNVVGACIIFDELLTGTDYFYVYAPKMLFRILLIEFLVFYGVDKSNFWQKMRRIA